MLNSTLKKIRKFLVEQDGPTAIEYLVMISVILIACLLLINAIGQITQSSFNLVGFN